MSEFAQKVKKWYALGLWSEEQVSEAAGCGALSAEEYRRITGKELSR